MSFERLCYIVSDEIILHSNFSMMVLIFVSDKCYSASPCLSVSVPVTNLEFEEYL